MLNSKAASKDLKIQNSHKFLLNMPEQCSIRDKETDQMQVSMPTQIIIEKWEKMRKKDFKK